MKHLQITITAAIPDDNDELGHEAVVATKDTVAAVVTALVGLGLHAEHSRRLVTRRDEAKPRKLHTGQPAAE